MSTVTVYTIRTADHHRFGLPADIRLYVPAGVELTWVDRAEYELPEGYRVGLTRCDEPVIYNNSGHDCPLCPVSRCSTEPEIIDIDANPTYIKLKKVQDLPW